MGPTRTKYGNTEHDNRKVASSLLKSKQPKRYNSFNKKYKGLPINLASSVSLVPKGISFILAQAGKTEFFRSRAVIIYCMTDNVTKTSNQTSRELKLRNKNLDLNSIFKYQFNH